MVNRENHWHTNWSDFQSGITSPHFIEVNMGEDLTIKGIVYTPRQDQSNGRITKYDLEVSLDGKSWAKVVENGNI